MRFVRPAKDESVLLQVSGLMRSAFLLAKPSSGTCTFMQHLGGDMCNTRKRRREELAGSRPAVPVRSLGGFLDSGEGSGSAKQPW